MTHAVAHSGAESRPGVKPARRLRILMAHWDGGGNAPPPACAGA
jgi:hypothetical protein